MGNSDLREAEARWLEEPEGAPGNCEECTGVATCTALDASGGVMFLCERCYGPVCEGCEVPLGEPCQCGEPTPYRGPNNEPF